MVMWTGVPSPICWPRCLGRVAVEDRGEEDRAALGVEVEHFRRVGREAEAVLVGPVGHVRAAALEHGQVERVDARFQHHLDARRRAPALGAAAASGARRRRFADQSLQGPGAAALDAGGHVGQRDERAELAAAAQELEGGDVVLDAVVVGRQGRRAAEVDRAVRADQPGAGEGRAGENERSQQRTGADNEDAHSTLDAALVGMVPTILAGGGRDASNILRACAQD